ncbi:MULTISPECIES: response regulator [unclassified Sphingomonas]|uniref:response regulator n=1 Tax=unclassified Sphingomonas TaxID=196159 RepID=UPI00226A3A52|nr:MULTISPECIES: response regulator [unclassified Sphingomonas]
MNDYSLRGCRILVAEDEYLLADDLTSALAEVGAVVVGPAPSLAAALRLIATEPPLDGAVLDINLAGEVVYPVADLLIERGVRLVFATGYDASAILTRYAGIPRCEKPVSMRKLAQAIGHAISQ